MSIRIKGTDSPSQLHDSSQWGSAYDGSVGEKSTVIGATNKIAKGTYHMAMAANLYEIQRSNNFEFVIDFLEGDNYNRAAVGSDTIDGGIIQEVVRMSVTQASIPHFSQEAIQLKRGNTTLKYAGVPTFTDGTLTLNDFIGADTLAMVMAWQNLSYDVKTEKVGIATDYKKTAHLYEYSPDLQVVRKWTLYGCWVTGITEGDLSSDDNGKHTITVNISYDKAIIEE